ncbi:response regulator [Corynebacterium kalidii]|jgi:DNA-binding NarL/FixJ family response regulator
MTGTTGTVRVLVADDEPLVRAGVSAVLDADPTVAVVAEAGDGRAAVDLVLSHRPDVAVLDIRMPGLSGLEVVSELRRAGSDVPVVFVTTFGEDSYVSEATRLGAAGFVLKSGDPRELQLSVHAAASGGAFFSPSVARRLLVDGARGRLAAGAEAREKYGLLTAREQEVLDLVGEGMSNSEIAGRLHLAASTVKVHVSSILRTTGARNRVEAALIAVRAGGGDR